MMATKTRGVLNINDADKRLVTVNEVRKFEERLYKALLPAEIAAMSLDRLSTAHELDTLGGWPEGYEFPSEAVAAFALMADLLEGEAERMRELARTMRQESAHLWWVRGAPAEARDA